MLTSSGSISGGVGTLVSVDDTNEDAVDVLDDSVCVDVKAEVVT